MAKYVIDGGVPLKGEVEIYGAKNAAFKLMIASLLSDQTSRLENVSYVRDSIVVKQMIESLGGKAQFPGNHVVESSGQGLEKNSLESRFGSSSRAATLLLPVLLHRFKKARVPLPGGDKIGERPLDRHFEALKSLGAEIFVENGFIEASAESLIGTEFTFAKNTHTGTEMMLLAGCLASGKTTIRNAAAEPEVDDLISLLNKMGAQASRTEPRTIEVVGSENLRGANHQVMFDRNEAVTFACFALGTRGDVTIKNAQKETLGAFLEKIDEAGGAWEEVESGIRVFYKSVLNATQVQTAPYPGFMTDWQAIWATLMTQAKGVSTIHETVFENRFTYVPLLEKFGADIRRLSLEISEPEKIYNFNWSPESQASFHAAAISGPTKLYPAKAEVNDIRSGATLCLAALIAPGQSEVSNIELLERGYENLEGRLTGLGARIGKGE
ncbi:MAG: UDP-N-acetylglucosamine 1-carboxyvinyltransferase [bacterium]|nr:UDP-N-acetylglucosamine 1-carboxyvinyltransferase [bacterium]